MPLSFAYGSNIDRAAMAARCPASRPLGPARLPGHRPVVMREGYLSVARDPRHAVWGLLWDIALADIGPLDRYEDVASGLYAKVLRPVLTVNGPRRALVYVGRNAGPGVPLPGYLEAVVAAAERERLPAYYLRELATLGRTGSRSRGGGRAGGAPGIRQARPLSRAPGSPAGPGWVWRP